MVIVAWKGEGEKEGETEEGWRRPRRRKVRSVEISRSMFGRGLMGAHLSATGCFWRRLLDRLVPD